MPLEHPALTGFRSEVRSFIRSHLPADIAERGLQGFHSTMEDQVVWGKILHERGWSAPAWPVEFGGQGWDFERLKIFDEENYAAGAPELSWNGTRLVGPVIYTFGSDEQKARLLPSILNWDVFWGQGFSEPNAGSDLASLRTSAVRDGDQYVVNGSKTWMTDGHFAQWLFCLVRTSPSVKPQKGISFLVMDVGTPGIEMRPIATIDGQHTLNEVFFTDARVPCDNLIGGEGAGWTIAKFLLANERTGGAEVPRCKYYLQRLVELSRSVADDGRAIGDSPFFQRRLADLEAELIALDAAVELVGRGIIDDAASASVLKLKGAQLMQNMTELMVDAIGPDAIFDCARPETRSNLAFSDQVPGVTTDFLYRRACTIYGGAAEVQRNIIAATLLGARR